MFIWSWKCYIIDRLFFYVLNYFFICKCLTYILRFYYFIKLISIINNIVTSASYLIILVSMKNTGQLKPANYSLSVLNFFPVSVKIRYTEAFPGVTQQNVISALGINQNFSKSAYYPWSSSVTLQYVY